MLGRTLNKYRLVRLLGEGGMGSVYEAHDARSGARVAIKVLRPTEPAVAEAAQARFRIEAEVARLIDSPHIAAVFDTGTDPETSAPFMVMERLVGEDLHELLRRVGPLSPEVALRIGAQVCRGLVRAHEAGVIHRDIKPANLFLSQLGNGDVTVKILDFGIAKFKASRDPRLPEQRQSFAGSLLGSLHYMSPEQARCERTLDERSDIWSLGIVLYRALTGHLPHEELRRVGELILAISSELPRPLQELAPWVPTEIATVVHAALQSNPERRFSSAAAMLDAIEALLPHGDDLDVSMLASLDDAERAPVSPVVDMPTMQMVRRVRAEKPAPKLSSIPPTFGYDRPAVLPPAPRRPSFAPHMMATL